MKYRSFFQSITNIIISPQKTWSELVIVYSESDNTEKSLLYNLTTLCLLSTLLGNIIYKSENAVISIIINSIITALSYYGTFALILFLFQEYLLKKFELDTSKKMVSIFLTHSLILPIVLTSVISIMPGLFFLQIINIYTVYIVWEGVSIMTNINENKKNNFVLIIASIVIITPFVLSKVLIMIFPIATL